MRDGPKIGTLLGRRRYLSERIKIALSSAQAVDRKNGYRVN